MTRARSRRSGGRRTIELTSACLVVLAIAIVATIIQESGPASLPWHSDADAGSQHIASPAAVPPGETHAANGRGALPQTAPADSEVPRDAPADGTITGADGAVPDGVTVFDDGYPAVANLNPGLLQALRSAATDAAGHGIRFYVTSGWRSQEYQAQLFRDAIATYGSEEEAARWVAPP
ncbi:MAG: D-alanyl-D-alanine carboxypeptidase family protein, partial [Hyphomicrobiales bacterium]